MLQALLGLGPRSKHRLTHLPSQARPQLFPQHHGDVAPCTLHSNLLDIQGLPHLVCHPTPINQVTQPPDPQTFSISVHLVWRSFASLPVSLGNSSKAHLPCPLKYPLLFLNAHKLLASTRLLPGELPPNGRGYSPSQYLICYIIDTSNWKVI